MMCIVFRICYSAYEISYVKHDHQNTLCVQYLGFVMVHMKFSMLIMIIRTHDVYSI